MGKSKTQSVRKPELATDENKFQVEKMASSVIKDTGQDLQRAEGQCRTVAKHPKGQCVGCMAHAWGQGAAHTVSWVLKVV